MTIRQEGDITVITADEGKDLYNNFLECNAGKECWLGYVYYDKDGNKLDEPHMLTVSEFTEIDEEERPEPEPFDPDAMEIPTEEA